MDNIFLSAILAFIASYITIPGVIKISLEKKLYDEPDQRKVHQVIKPTLGGVGMFSGFILALLLGFNFNQAPEFQYYAAAAIIVFFTGLADDLLDLSPVKKMIGQLVATGIVMRFGGIELKNLYGLFGFHEIPYFLSLFISGFTIIVITNAINLIDGVDGLAGSICLVASLVFGVLFYTSGQLPFAVMAFSLAAAILGFLIYNFSPAKIFMGDTGSLLLGLICSVMVIKLINLIGTGGISYISPDAAPAIGMGILAVPLFDTLRVFTLRMSEGKSPFSADRRHIHHYLLDIGLSHRQVALSAALATLIFTALSLGLKSFNCTISLAILLGLALAATYGIINIRKKVLANREAEQLIDQNFTNSNGVVSVIAEPGALVEAD